MKYSICAWAASVGCIILSCLLLFWNPYTRMPVDDQTILIVFIMLILPACIGILAAASIPSVWNLYGAVLILYAISLGRLSV